MQTGEIGELIHRGGCISLGYWNDKKSTKKKVFKNLKEKMQYFLET